MPFAPPPEQLLDQPEMVLMELFGRMRSLATGAGFTGTLPALCSAPTRARRSRRYSSATSSTVRFSTSAGWGPCSIRPGWDRLRTTATTWRSLAAAISAATRKRASATSNGYTARWLHAAPRAIGSLLEPETSRFSKRLDKESFDPLTMLEVSIFEFLPDIVTSPRPHRRLSDVNTWRQFHRLASYLTDTFDSGERDTFVAAGLTLDHSIRRNTFIPPSSGSGWSRAGPCRPSTSARPKSTSCC